MYPVIKIVTNIESSVYIDDKYVGIAEKDRLFQYELSRKGDYLIRLEERKILERFSLTKIVNVINDTLVEFDFSKVLLEHQECLSNPSISSEPYGVVKFKYKDGKCEIWSARYDVKLSEISNNFNDIKFYGYHDKECLLLMINESGSSIINLAGETLIEVSIGKIFLFSDNFKFGIYSDGDKFGLFDNYGKIQEPTQYLSCEQADSGLFAVLNDNDKYAFIDLTHPLAITTIKCAGVDVKDTYAILVEKNKYGIYEYGSCYYPCIYDDVKEDYGGFVVSIDNKYGFLFDGKNIINCEFDEIEIVPDREYIDHDLQHDRYPRFFRVEKEGKYGLIDIKGKILLSTSYESIMEVKLYIEIMAELDENYISYLCSEDTYRYLVLITEEQELELFDCEKHQIISSESSTNAIIGNKIYFDRLR